LTSSGGTEWFCPLVVGLGVLGALLESVGLYLFVPLVQGLSGAEIRRPVRPLVVAHSFGGFIGMTLAARHADRLRGAVLLDSAIEPPSARTEGPPRRRGPNRVYPTFEAALARFRLAPPQPCENLFAIDFIARESIKSVEGGFTWKFDPFVFRDFDLSDLPALLAAAACPISLVWGERSNLVTPLVADYMARTAPAGAPLIAVPEADHHVMLDQPLAFVAAIRGLMSAWPR
jgi:pimeloyl-ACP methyl ester carboxylesterase